MNPDAHVIDATIHAVSYLRVSTKDQAKKGGEPEGLSIPAQREAIEAKAASGFACTIRHHFSDMGESARTSDRPGLQELLTYLLSNQVDFVFVHKIDRLARNRFDDIEITMAIRKAGAQLVSVTENIDETPSGMLMHGIMSSIAEFYSRNLASEVKKGMRQKVRSGGTPGKTPLGYLNTRTVGPTGGDVRTVETDSERAPLVKMAFELYASGDYSIDALHAELASQGLVTRPTPKMPARPLSRPQLCMMLRNKYYLGIVTYEGEEFQGKHEPLISIELFDRVQDILDERSRRGSRDRVHRHYLKGMLFCDRCHEVGRTSRLVYSENVGQSGNLYPYYKCLGRQRHGCDLPYLPVPLVEEAIVDFYAHLHLPEELLEELNAELTASINDQTDTARAVQANLKRHLQELAAQEERLLDMVMDGTLPQLKIKERLAKIDAERRQIEGKVSVAASDIAVGVAVLQSGLSLLRDAQSLYHRSPDEVRSQLNRAFFHRLRIDDHGHVTHATLNEPFAVLHGDPTAAVSTQKKTPANGEGLRSDTFALHSDPKVSSWSKNVLVAGAVSEFLT